ncbi:MAG: hypothetical protein KBD00_00060 [Candidatus Peribacteraceae bacterium]|nr:hypothetical protein [Candidatus Peribacteraceae bacterium]
MAIASFVPKCRRKRPHFWCWFSSIFSEKWVFFGDFADFGFGKPFYAQKTKNGQVDVRKGVFGHEVRFTASTRE